MHLTGGSLAAKKRGFNAQAFFGTMSIVHTRPPASNAHRWAANNRAKIYDETLLRAYDDRQDKALAPIGAKSPREV